ncbi:MAG TPA: hypothetical protein VMW38_13360 [Terriglobia bacterium]|nr:hypothetical protein [Terriglobia bacterium]
MKTRLLIAWLTVLCLVSCSRHKDSSPGPKDAKPVLKISVLQSGKIFLDGKESSMAQVEENLDQLKKKAGEVWYFREAGQQAAPPIAMQVVRMVVAKRIPITLSSKSDFSDYIGEDGQPHSRK